MCTPSLAVSGLPWMFALGGLGRSLGTWTGQLTGLVLLGLGQGGGVVDVTDGATDGVDAALGPELDPVQAVRTAARAASARHDAPRARSMCGHPSVGKAETAGSGRIAIYNERSRLSLRDHSAA